MRLGDYTCQNRKHKRFNPRIHEGCDYGGVDKMSEELSFNPRIREGCDASHDAWTIALFVF